MLVWDTENLQCPDLVTKLKESPLKSWKVKQGFWRNKKERVWQTSLLCTLRKKQFYVSLSSAQYFLSSKIGPSYSRSSPFCRKTGGRCLQFDIHIVIREKIVSGICLHQQCLKKSLCWNGNPPGQLGILQAIRLGISNVLHPFPKSAKLSMWAQDGFPCLSPAGKLEKYKSAYSFHCTRITFQMVFRQTLRESCSTWNI